MSLLKIMSNNFLRCVNIKTLRINKEIKPQYIKYLQLDDGIELFERNLLTKFLLVSSADDSPVKTTKSRKRLRISSSSSENESENDMSKNNTDKATSVSSRKSSEPKLSQNSQNAKKNSTKNEIKFEKEKSISETTVTDKITNKTPKKLVKLESPETVNENCNKEPEKDDKTEEKVDVTAYNPSKSNYHPIKDACWKRGEKVPYYALAKTLNEIDSISTRLKMSEILSNFLRSVIVLSPDDFLPSIYLCLNKLGPAHEGVELGLAEQTLIRAMSQSTGRTVTQIRNEIHEVGDIGLVAERSRAAQKLMFKPAPLTVSGIFKKFTEIAGMTGQAVLNKKISTIQTLFVACQGPEAKFLMRSLNGKLRIGLAEQSALQAIALACAMTPPGQSYPPEKINVSSSMSSENFKALLDEWVLILKTTYCECPNYGLIIPVLLKEGIPALPKHCKVTPGLPMKPMLAQPTKGVQELLTRFEGLEFTCEYKYDGERAQIHCSEDGKINIFSRNQENNTSKYPDIISRIKSLKKDGVTSFILDCEAVAWDREENKILPFQVLSKRKRKDAKESEIKVNVCIYMFDLLYLNGKPLVREKFFERRRLLRENFNEVQGEWMFAKALDTSKMEEVQEFLEESVKGNCEGLMVKTLKEEATYEIAKRSRNWLKLKKDYLEGVGDTLDLVVLGGYLGKGKRTGTYGGFLVGCYDNDSEEYQSVCKLGTGFTDESLAAHTKFFQSHIITKAPTYYQYHPNLEPDHWFEPVQVWETKCADLSLSPVHRAAIGAVDPEKGISLRFPRFLRIREDKKPEEATTAQQIIDLYHSQEQVKSQQGKPSRFAEEDFY